MGLYFLRMVPFLESFLIRLVLPLVIHSAVLIIYSVVGSVCHEGPWFFFKTMIHVSHHVLAFSYSVLSWGLLWARCMSPSGHSSRPCISFFHVMHPFSFSALFFLFPYYTSKLFCFLCIQLLVCSGVVSI